DEEAGHQPVIAFSPAEGVGTPVTVPTEPSNIGEGPSIDTVVRLLVDKENDRLLVNSGRRVRSVNLVNGDRSDNLFAPNLDINGMHIHGNQIFFNINSDNGTEIGSLETILLNEQNSPVEGFKVAVPAHDA